MKTKYKMILLSTLILAIFAISVISANNTQTIFTSGEESKTIGWGIKRNNIHEQPDVGEKNKKLLEENAGICLGKKEEKNIYLTFDSGYEAGYMDKILDTLKKCDVKATFFITSHYLNTASEKVERMISDGHIIGNHTPKFLMFGIEV